MLNWAIRILGLCIMLMMLATPLKAQNTKGDRPVQDRETRFTKSKSKKTKVKSAKRIKQKRTTTSLRAYRPRKKSKGGEVAGRPLYSVPRAKQDRRPKNYETPWYHTKPSLSRKNTEERAARQAKRHKVQPRSASGSIRNVYPQPASTTNVSSRRTEPKPQKRKVIPKSVSKPYIARRSINAWANFPRPKPKKEKAFRGDIAGRPLRRKNFESERPGIIHTPASAKGSGSFRQNRLGQSSGAATPVSRRTPRPVSNKDVLENARRMQTPGSGGAGKRIKETPRSASGSFLARKSPNVWAHFPRKKRKGERAVTTDIAGRRLSKRNYQSPRPGLLPAISLKSSSAGFRSRGKRTAGSVSSSGKPWKGDIAGRKIRRYNRTTKAAIETVGVRKNYPGSATRSGKVTGKLAVRPPGVRSRGIGSYQGDIQSTKGFNNQGEEFTGSVKARRRAQGGGSVSGRLWNNDRRAIAPRLPGMGGSAIKNYRGQRATGKGFLNQGEEFTGSIKARRQPKGGGSVSGRLWNNDRRAISPRMPGIGGTTMKNYRGQKAVSKGFSNQGEEFTGSIKARRQPKGGGSVSGRLWNNDRRAISGRIPGIGASSMKNYKGQRTLGRGFSNQGEEYSGSVKARRIAKGGGSISGKLWNNNQLPIPARVPGIGGSSIRNYKGQKTIAKGFSNQGEEYSGWIRARKPLKGGGSISGKLWNNNQLPIPARVPGIGGSSIRNYKGQKAVTKGFSNQGEEYTGSIKARKPLKGGGSISGKLWNNNESAIPVRLPGIGGSSIRNYKGQKAVAKGFSNQGEEYTGNIKQKRYIKNQQVADLALKKKKEKTAELTDGLQVKVATRKYVENKRTAEGSLKQLKPTKNTFDAGGLQVRVKEKRHGFKKDAPEGALAVLKPSKESLKAGEYTRVLKRNFDYVRNPSSAKEALKTREPGKAFARATDYQGNIKMAKFKLFDKQGLHPDAQFVKINKNNVDSERSTLTNLKLWWARLFKKNDTQPSHLKDREHKPRYDPREKGLWYD